MFKKVKNWLGIEGVKLELELPEVVQRDSGYIPGTLRLLSKQSQRVKSIEMKLVERYTRGRGDEQKIDEYTVGKMNLNKAIDVPGETPVQLEFKLPFEIVDSEMDQSAKKNFINRGIVSIAKWANAVSSKYFIIVEANVEGVALDPFVKQTIHIED